MWRQAVGAHRVWQAHATAALSAAVPDGCRDRLAALTAALGELADERPRAALSAARQLREIAGLIEPLAVAEALAHSVPWETIGTDLGQTKQAVNRRCTNPSRTLSARVEQLVGTNVETLLATARNRVPGTRPPGVDGPPRPAAWWTPIPTPTPAGRSDGCALPGRAAYEHPSRWTREAVRAPVGDRRRVSGRSPLLLTLLTCRSLVRCRPSPGPFGGVRGRLWPGQECRGPGRC